MGTRIDVDVAQALLAQRVKALAAANRGKRLEREQGERDKAKIQGAIERGVDGTAGGGGGSGGIGGPSGNGRGRAGQAASLSPLADLDAQLRAGTLRSGVPEYYTGPRVAATPQGGKGWLLVPSDTEFRAKVRGMPAFQYIQAGAAIMSVLPTAGPAGTSAMFSLEGSGSSLFSESPEGPPNGIQILKEARGKAFTLEFMYKLAPSVYSEEGPYSFVSTSFGGIAGIGAGQAWSLSDSPPFEAADPFAYLQFGYGQGSTVSIAFISNSVRGFIGAGVAGLGRPVTDEYRPEINTTEWQHAAIVQTPGPSPETRNVSLYSNGTRLRFYEGVPPEDLPIYGPEWERRASEVSVVYGYATELGDPPSFDPPVNESSLAHGVRYTSRALYTGDTYTPPTSITRLA